MAVAYASGKHSIATCDRCGFQYKLKQLKSLVIKGKDTSIFVCPECWEGDQPQLKVGMYPVNDPQAVRDSRPDTSYYQSGYDRMGSRVTQWGWNPVGLNNPLGIPGLENDLVGQSQLGRVTVEIN